MGEYRVEKTDGRCYRSFPYVVRMAHGEAMTHCLLRADAERIARALAVLDVVERHGDLLDRLIDDDVRRADQARGEG